MVNSFPCMRNEGVILSRKATPMILFTERGMLLEVSENTAVKSWVRDLVT